MWDWLQHFLGADDSSGAWYSFWSGFGADLGELAILGAAIGVYRKHNCHVHRCWRIAKQDVLGTSWRVCHHHHPLGRPTAQDVIDRHEAYVTRQGELDAARRATVSAGLTKDAADVTADAATARVDADLDEALAAALDDERRPRS